MAGRMGRSRASAMAVTLLAVPATAQEPPPPAAPPASSDAAATSDAPAGDAIVVTARRRDENAQTVPVSVAVFGAQDLEQKQVRTLSDLTSITPGVRFVAQGGSGNTNVVLRGLAKGAAGDSPNSVITYFGDVPLYFRGSDIPTYDLQSVQVLKGPQGTLFGRNAIAGAVILTPAAPSFRLEGHGRVAVGNYDLRDVEGALNLPVVDDRLAVRVAGRVTRRDGYVSILNQDTRGFDNISRQSIRASVLAKPVDGVRSTTVFDYTTAHEVDANALLFAALGTGLVRPPALANPIWTAGCGASRTRPRSISAPSRYAMSSAIARRTSPAITSRRATTSARQPRSTPACRSSRATSMSA